MPIGSKRAHAQTRRLTFLFFPSERSGSTRHCQHQFAIDNHIITMIFSLSTGLSSRLLVWSLSSTHAFHYDASHYPTTMERQGFTGNGTETQPQKIKEQKVMATIEED